MGKEVTGIIIEKAYHPPTGAPDKYWCYLIVETKKGTRVNVRLHQKIHDKFTIGDAIRFSKPWRKNKRVKDVQVIGRSEIK
jgi:hypothetical protein